jgi:hypothetical protein
MKYFCVHLSSMLSSVSLLHEANLMPNITMNEVVAKYAKHIMQETNVLFSRYLSAIKAIVVQVAIINSK